MFSYPVLIALVLVGVIAVAVVVSFTLNQRRRNVWRRFALRYGLTIVDSEDCLMLHGEIDACPIEIAIVDESSDAGTLGVQVVHFSTPIENLPDNLEVESASGVIGNLRKSLEPEAAETGDDELDRLTVVKCANAADAEFLTPMRKKAIEELMEDVSPAFVDLEDGVLRIADRTMISRVAALEQRCRTLMRCAATLKTHGDE